MSDQAREALRPYIWGGHGQRALDAFEAAIRAESEATVAALREAVLREGDLLRDAHGESCDCTTCLVVQPLVDAATVDALRERA